MPLGIGVRRPENRRGSETAGTVFYIPATTLISLLKDRGNRIKIKFHVRGDIDDRNSTFKRVF